MKKRKALLINGFQIYTAQETEAVPDENDTLTLTERVFDGVFLADTKGCLNDINMSGCRMFGYKRRELLGRKITELVDASERTKLLAMGSAVKKGEAVIGKLLCTRQDGTAFMVEINLRRLSDGRVRGLARDITERQYFERVLQESEARYRAVVEDQEELIRRFKPDGTLTFVNRAFCRYFGKTVAELLGTDFINLFPVEDHENVKRQLAALTQVQPVAEAERKFVRRDGDVRWQQWVNRAIFNKAGMLVEYQSVGRDITRQKQMEQQLQESEARYRAVVEDQEELIRRFKPDGTLTFVNGAFCRYFGKTANELLGTNFINLFPLEDHEKVKRQLAALTCLQPVAEAERKFVRTDGEIWWQQWVNRAIFNEVGMLVEYQSVGRDITRQKQMEQQLQESEARYRAIVEDQTDLICRFTPAGTLTFVNQALCRFYNKNAEELIGQNLIMLMSSPNRELIFQQLLLLTHEAPVVTTDPCYVECGGSLRWLQYVNRAIFDENGDVIEYQSVARDISAQREAEIKISEAREAIARAAQVTTLAVIGGGIAHEINQPLNAVRVLTETLLHLHQNSNPSTAEVVKNLQSISQQIDRTDSIVNHLRSFLRTSQTFEYNPCDLNDVVEKLLSFVSNQLVSRGIKVKKELDQELPMVNGSFVRFEEIVLNLLMNAMQALDGTDHKRKEIIIRTWADESVNLAVVDNGPGIDPAVYDRIFEPFFTTKKSGESMGLGLSIVHSIVSASNGSIRVKNNLEGGATIQVILPAGSEMPV